MISAGQRDSEAGAGGYLCANYELFWMLWWWNFSFEFALILLIIGFCSYFLCAWLHVYISIILHFGRILWTLLQSYVLWSWTPLPISSRISILTTLFILKEGKCFFDNILLTLVTVILILLSLVLWSTLCGPCFLLIQNIKQLIVMHL